ncbi:MAG: hypothetical protein HUJ95_00915, partial [Bacteroidales bacterium]|nr:hypothetical protein [Bacteroidales bacterium]
DGFTLETVKNYQQENIKGRTYNYCILGDIKDLDIDYLKTLGEIKIVTKEQVFGY